MEKITSIFLSLLFLTLERALKYELICKRTAISVLLLIDSRGVFYLKNWRMRNKTPRLLLHLPNQYVFFFVFAPPKKKCTDGEIKFAAKFHQEQIERKV